MICWCCHCKKELGELSYQLFRNVFTGYDNIGRRKLFCSEQCYNEYIQQYQVAEYKCRPIYKVEIEGVTGYIPWWFAPYFFTDIDSCKQRMDMPNIAIVDRELICSFMSQFSAIKAKAFNIDFPLIISFGC